MVSLDIRDIEILYALYTNNKSSAFNTFTVRQVMEVSGLEFSYHCFLRSFRIKLLPMGFVKEGYKCGNSKTFFITEVGIKYLEDNIIDDTFYQLQEMSEEEGQKILGEEAVTVTYDEESNAKIYEIKKNL